MLHESVVLGSQRGCKVRLSSHAKEGSSMVIQCRSCKGLIRCDPVLASGDMAHRIRCPHCGREGFIVRSKPLERDADLEILTPEPDLDKDIVLEQRGENSHFREKKDVWELEAPQGYREEVETMSGVQRPFGAKPAASGINWVRWIAASLAVVIAFALFVNLILPGPTGRKLFGGVTFQGHGTGADTPIENRAK